MASKIGMHILVLELVLLFSLASAGRTLNDSHVKEEDTMKFQYHNGPLLSGKISINLIWYGQFKPSQRVVISDFINSISSSHEELLPQPSVLTWWNKLDKYYTLIKSKKPHLSLSNQIFDQDYSQGKSLKISQIQELAKKGGLKSNTINVVLTSSDVGVEGFCFSKCGTHGSLIKKFGYIWVGNSETQCPGQCAWPFHKPTYGPQNPPLIAPNNDVGLDGMIINLGSLLAGTVTDPFGNGYYQGPSSAPLEASSACPGVFGKGAYPGYAGNLLKDWKTGASFNAYGAKGNKYLLPALYDPSTSACSTLT